MSSGVQGKSLYNLAARLSCGVFLRRRMSLQVRNFKRVWRIVVILMIGQLWAAWGCGQPYRDGPKVMGNDRISPRGRWLAYGNLRDPHLAIDGNPSTAAVSEVFYHGAALTIDLGKFCQFNMVIIDHGSNEFGFCGRVAVLTSDDGQWFRQQVVVPGLRRVTTAVLARQVLARYIRLQALEPGKEPWSIAEVHLN